MQFDLTFANYSARGVQCRYINKETQTRITGYSKSMDIYSPHFDGLPLLDMKFLGPDRKAYGVIQRKGLLWMTENFAGRPGRVYQDGSMYGRYYSWEQVKSACPKGWRLPTEEELIEFAQEYGPGGTMGTEMRYGENVAAAFLSGGESGLDLETGGTYEYGEFDFVGDVGAYWVANEKVLHVWDDFLKISTLEYPGCYNARYVFDLK